MRRGLRILFGALAVAEGARGVGEVLARDYLDASYALALAVLFALFAAGTDRPARGTARWYGIWGAAALALVLLGVRWTIRLAGS